MIKNTYADCKVINTRVTGSTAYVTLLIFASKPAETQRGFKFYITDDTTNLLTDDDYVSVTPLSNNIYWIDRTNNYENATTNIDTNMYKEIVLEIDIAKHNQGEVRNNRWVRECRIIMKDYTEEGEPIAWVSQMLTLISTPIILPKIKELSFISDMDYNLIVDYDYVYETQEDFNYQSRNIYTDISVVSNSTLKVLETITVKESDIKDGHVRVQFANQYNDYIKINITIRNNKGVAMYTLEKLYYPQRRVENTYIKINGEVKRVNYIYYKGNDTIVGGPLLNDEPESEEVDIDELEQHS